MLESTLCQISLLQILFWGFVAGMLYQLGREIVEFIFHRNKYEKDS